MFKVGQLITGTPRSNDRYGITNSKAILKVVTVQPTERDDKTIVVTLVKHSNLNYSHRIGNLYPVHSDYFVPLHNKPAARRKHVTKTNSSNST